MAIVCPASFEELSPEETLYVTRAATRRKAPLCVPCVTQLHPSAPSRPPESLLRPRSPPNAGAWPRATAFSAAALPGGCRGSPFHLHPAARNRSSSLYAPRSAIDEYAPAP